MKKVNNGFAIFDLFKESYDHEMIVNTEEKLQPYSMDDIIQLLKEKKDIDLAKQYIIRHLNKLMNFKFPMISRIEINGVIHYRRTSYFNSSIIYQKERGNW